MEKKYINPYLGGFLLGIVITASAFFTNQTLGTSGAFHRMIISFVAYWFPSYAQSTPFYANFLKNNAGTHVLNNWVVYEVIGIILGGFISALFARRLKFTIDKGPNISSTRRLAFALFGGIFFGFGSRLAHGCASGAALSGMALLSASGFLATTCMFGMGYACAYFVRKNWI